MQLEEHTGASPHLYAAAPDGEQRDVTSDSSGRSFPLSLEPARCCICDTSEAQPIAVGEDFEYRTSPDTFLAMRCTNCGLVYLNPRPSEADLPRIYPPDYHAFSFSEERYGFVYKVRRRLEAHRLLNYCRGLGDRARIIDVGCGDGFHLRLLRDFGNPSWRLEGADMSERAVDAAARHGLTVHRGTIEQLDLPRGAYDAAFLIQTIEHVADPPAVVRAVRELLRPGGKIIIVTDNTDSLDFKLFKGRHWGGYHFPRHWNLFNRRTMNLLADKVEMEVESLDTVVSPVNWTYSLRNMLVDLSAPAWLIRRFSLQSPGALAAFTLFDTINQAVGRGALLRAILRRPQ